MKPIIRYAGTTKTPVATYEVYFDGLRIGFVKMRKTNGKESWHSTQWCQSHIGLFSNQKTATNAVINRYKYFQEHCKAKRTKTFEERAVKLKK